MTEDHDETTGDSTDSEGSKDIPEDSCESMKDFECFDKAPPGWLGPYRISYATKKKSLNLCDPVDPSTALLYEGLKAQPAICINCYVNPELPECTEEFQIGAYAESGEDTFFFQCLPEKLSSVAKLPFDRCNDLNQIAKSLTGPNELVGYLLPPVGDKKVVCGQPNPEKKLPDVSANSYWQICKRKENPACKDTGKECLKKRSESAAEPACIFSESKTQCPSSIYTQRTELVAGYEDTRNCSECRVKHEKGEFQCRSNFEYYRDDDPNCEQGKNSILYYESILKSCEKMRPLLDHPEYLVIPKATPTYTGRCDTEGWKPLGKVVPNKWLTVCCNF